MLFQLLKLVVGDIDQRSVYLLLLARQQGDKGKVNLRLMFTDAANDLLTVLLEIRAQHLNRKFVQSRARTARATTAGIADLERARVAFPERCHGLLWAF